MDFYLVLTWVVYILAVVESTLCPDEEGLKVVPVCTAQTANGRDVAISTNGTQHIGAGTCHCTVAVYAVDDTPAPTLYYQGPGYPRCGLEIDVGGDVFRCFDGILDLIEEEYEITYTNTIRNMSPEACLLFYSGGRNVEYRVTCQQPHITITNSPPTTTDKNQTPSAFQPTSATSLSTTTTSASTSTPSSTGISDKTEAMNITTSSMETTSSTDDKLSTTLRYTLTTETDDSTTSSIPSTNEITSQTSTSHPTTTSFEVSSSSISSTVTATFVQSTSETSPLSATTTSNLLSTETSTEASTKPFVKTTVTTIDVGESSLTSTTDEYSPGATSTFITTTTGNRNIDLGAVFIKNEEFPFVLVISLCSGFLVVTAIVIVFFFVRRSKSKRTSIPWNVNRSEPNPYIDAFSPEQSIVTDEEVYFTGLPVIPDIPDGHVTENHVTGNHVTEPNIIQYSYIDESLTTPRETDIYAVVMKRPDSFVSLPRPKLKSFQGMEDQIEGSDIEDELLEIIEKESKQSGSRVSLNGSISVFDNETDDLGNGRGIRNDGSISLFDVEVEDFGNDLGIRNIRDENQRSVSFRETMKYHNDGNIFTNKTPDLHAESGRAVQEMPMKSPRAVSFRETIQVSNGEIVFNTRKPKNIQLMDSTTRKDHVKVHKSTSFEKTFNRPNETTNIDPKLQKDNRTPTLFRSVSQNPQDHLHDDKDTKYDANMPRKERRRPQLSRSVSENPQDHLREMFLRDLRKAFKKRQMERHAF